MTLGTYIRIDQPVPVKPLLDHLTVLVGGDPATAERVEKPGMIANRLGQGFAAIVDIDYGLDGPLQLEYLDVPDKWTVEHDEPFTPAPAAIIQVDLDTAYGYRDEHGRGCVELHRDLISATAEWVRERAPSARVWAYLDIESDWWAV